MSNGKALRTDVEQYVRRGGRDAFEFSMSIYPHYSEVPGDEIQRMIDGIVNDEKTRGRR